MMHLWQDTRDTGVRNAVYREKIISTLQLIRTKVGGKVHYIRHQKQLFSYSDGTRRPRVDIVICSSKRQKFKSTVMRVTIKLSPCHLLFYYTPSSKHQYEISTQWLILIVCTTY